MGKYKNYRKKVKLPSLIDANIIIIGFIIIIFVFLIGRAVGKRELYNKKENYIIKNKLLLLNEI